MAQARQAQSASQFTTARANTSAYWYRWSRMPASCSRNLSRTAGSSPGLRMIRRTSPTAQLITRLATILALG